MKEGVLSYLKALKRAEESQNIGSKRVSKRYSSVTNFLLEEGRYWILDKGFDFKINVETFPKHCFWNAFKLAKRNSNKLFYVEGYAIKYDLGISIHHAWCVTKEGIVVDPTWSRYSNFGDEYYGTAFDVEFVKTQHTKDNLSVLYNWKNDFQILKDKYEMPSELKMILK